MSETIDDDPNDEPRLMTRIDGEEARLLVHIKPIGDTDDGAGGAVQAPPPDSSGLAE